MYYNIINIIYNITHMCDAIRINPVINITLCSSLIN